MPDCIFIKECAFYNNKLKDTRGMNDFLKGIFCHMKPVSCMRLRLSGSYGVSSAENNTTPLLSDYHKSRPAQ